MNSSNSPVVYSTGQGRICPECGKPFVNCPGHQRKVVVKNSDGIVRISLDSKGRKGKDVTVITGIPVSEDTLETLAKQLKRKCGAGGTVKDLTIEIQGDHRKTIMTELVLQGYKVRSI